MLIPMTVEITTLPPDDPIGKGGKVAKFNANIEAISILKQLEGQKRNATPEEQSKLVLYTGWGGLSEVFKKELTGRWEERQGALKTILTDEEYRSASRSTINAHFTTPSIIGGVWDAAIRMGYAGGPYPGTCNRRRTLFRQEAPPTYLLKCTASNWIQFPAK